MFTSSLNILKYSHEIGCTLRQKTLTMAASYGDMSTVRWIIKKGILPNATTARVCAKYGHTKMLKWLYGYNPHIIKDVPATAGRYGRMDIIDLLRSLGDEWILLGICKGAASSGQIEILEMMFSHHGESFSRHQDKIQTAAASHDRVDVLHWLESKNLKSKIDISEAASKHNSTRVLEYLKINDMNISTRCLYLSCKKGNMMAFLWSILNGCEIEDNILEVACKGGNLEMVKLIYDFCPFFSDRCLTRACESGNLELLQWLVDRSQVEVVNKKFNSWIISGLGKASEYGYFEMMKWIISKAEEYHYISSENSRYMNFICENVSVRDEDVEMLEWMMDRGWEPEMWSILQAATLGSFSVLKLFHRRGTVFSENIIAHSCTSKRLDMMDWLYELRYPIPRESAMYALITGDVLILKWLIDRGAHLGASFYSKLSQEKNKHLYRWFYSYILR